MTQSKRDHWEKVWGTRQHEGVSWYAPHLAESLRLIREVVKPAASVIDVGGGASTLVDDLLEGGFSHITVLDVAEGALEACGVVAHDVEAAASRWSTQRESTDDDPAARFEAAHERVNVGISIGRLGQEVEDRTVVPDVECRLRQRHRGDVGVQPCDR